MKSQSGYGTITPHEVWKRLSTGERLRIIDVREPLEYRIARIDYAQLIPLGDLPSKLDAIDPDEHIVLMCHHGIRSASACAYLSTQGYQRISNMSGGIDRWSTEVDSSIPRY